MPSTETPATSTTWTFTCRNHPHLRWSKNKCGPGFIGRGVLIFEGDAEARKPSSPFSETESSLASKPVEYQEHFRKKYAVECDCPYTDLVVFAKKYQPVIPADYDEYV